VSRLAAGSFVVSAGAVVALHVLRPELSPVSQRLSEYATGAFGWVMTVAFVAAAVGLLALAVAHRTRGTAAPLLLAVAAAGMVLAGLFPAGTSDRWHSPASSVATLAVAGAVAIDALASRRQLRPGLDLALAGAAALLVVASPVLHDTAWSGLGQRLLWAVLYVWLVRAAGWRLAVAGTAGRVAG
jgi:hypothetical membrane protein